MKEIKLHNGGVTLVDDEDYEFLNQWSWSRNKKGYVLRHIFRRKDNYREVIYMARLIMGNPVGKTVDHIDGNPLNNRRSNLRVCSKKENGRNRSKQVAPTLSIYKGVTKPRRGKQWRAQINYNQTISYIGGFLEERHAALAYDMWAMPLFGKYAKPNFKVVSFK